MGKNKWVPDMDQTVRAVKKGVGDMIKAQEDGHRRAGRTADRHWRQFGQTFERDMKKVGK